MSTDTDQPTAAGGYLFLADHDLPPLMNEVSEKLIDQVLMPAEEAAGTGWNLPPVLSEPGLDDAWYRIYYAVTRLVEAAVEDDELVVVTPTRNSCTPLVLADVDPADVERIRELDRHLQLAIAEPGRPGRDQSHEDLDDMLDQIADHYGNELADPRTGQRRDGGYLAGMLHEVLELLDLSAGDGAQLLRAAVAEAKGGNVHLTDSATAGAYQELVLATVRIIGGGGLKTWMHYGNADGTMPRRL